MDRRSGKGNRRGNKNYVGHSLGVLRKGGGIESISECEVGTTVVYQRTVLTQEVLRVMMNCSRMLQWEKVVKKVKDFLLRMQYSGYDKKFRYEVVASALNAYRIRKEADERGERPM
ncbi:Hypothetical predicted protein [Paramuricea clavata]|uniref:Uncharacterized protein n=1 Tax=Paramuricea clavata TaxID=317549 RepID=A0A6S7KLF9_PARCT|nr:Hypothetical predicted protein [Paramuricea clavata]